MHINEHQIKFSATNTKIINPSSLFHVAS